MDMTYYDPLPDPDRNAEFYADTPAKRLIAWVADMVLVAILCALILPFTLFTGLFFFPFLMLVVGFAYRVVTLTAGSATWGMRLMSMELRTAKGARLDLSTAILHTLGYTISLGMFPLQIVSIVLMLTSARRQSLSDHILGTVPLNRSAGY